MGAFRITVFASGPEELNTFIWKTENSVLHSDDPKEVDYTLLKIHPYPPPSEAFFIALLCHILTTK